MAYCVRFITGNILGKINKVVKKLWLHSVKIYLKLGLFFYFRRIRVHGLTNLPKGKPVLLLSNHQNALLDALLIASRLDHFAYFLTRAGVFQKAFVSKLLDSFNMLPVYRIRDGWSNLTNNNPIFEKCTALLRDGHTVVIFPEGSHNLARRVRPLSKGFTRIVFDTLKTYPETDLQLVPVGLNFVNAKDFVDSTSLYFGKSLSAKDYVTEDRNQGVVRLKADVHHALTQLTANIPEAAYEDTLERLEQKGVDFLDPKAVNQCIATDLKDCKTKPKSAFDPLRALLKGLLILNILPPYLLWKFYVQPKIKELEFTSTFRFAVAITVVPLYLLIVSAIIASVFTFNIGLGYFLTVILLALAAVKL